jgi:NTE family protein
MIMAVESKHTAKNHYAVGYALSGGFIKGFAHLGVIQALAEHDIHPDILSGISAGAVAAAFIADGREPYETIELFKDLHFKDLTRLILPKRGIYEMDYFMDFLRSHLVAQRIEELKIPLTITATDLDNAKRVHFTRGSLAERICASCCLPILFAPIRINGVHYVDGGLFGNIPVMPIRKQCDKVVAINVSPLKPEKYKLNILGIAVRSYHLMFSSNSAHECDFADLFIEPEDLTGYSNRQLEKAEDIFNQGYKSATLLLNSLINEKGTVWN